MVFTAHSRIVRASGPYGPPASAMAGSFRAPAALGNAPFPRIPAPAFRRPWNVTHFLIRAAKPLKLPRKRYPILILPYPILPTSQIDMPLCAGLAALVVNILPPGLGGKRKSRATPGFEVEGGPG
jgi:hypothetical protein